MMQKLMIVILIVISPVFSAGIAAEEVVRKFSGSRSMETAEFEVKAPWLIDWRVNSDFPSSMGISVGKVFKTKKPGNGVRLMDEGGRYRFKVDATVANWSLKVIQLTPEEAEQYTPKNALDY
jgi:hypothetical protein